MLNRNSRSMRGVSKRLHRPPDQTLRLKASGLDYYNHNLDTSLEFYGEIITTWTYQDRLDTLDAVRAAGIHVCCGGIVGMGSRWRIASV
jgi:biotin synthase-like enzyme